MFVCVRVCITGRQGMFYERVGRRVLGAGEEGGSMIVVRVREGVICAAGGRRG